MSVYHKAKIKANYFTSGQALLIVLLTMAVAIVVVLSVVSKSVTDVAITSTEEDSLRAFSSAEAGVEEALLNVVPGTITNDPGDSVVFNTNVTQDPPGSSFNYPEQLVSGETATIWFVGRNNSGILSCETGITCTRTTNLDFCWGTSAATPTEKEPAIEVTVYYDSSATRTSFLHPGNPTSLNFANLRAYTLAADPNTSEPNAFEKVSLTSCPVSPSGQGTVTYRYRKNWTGLTGLINTCVNSASNCLVMARVRMLYNSATPQGFGLRVGGQLPAQGFKISSTGYSGDNNNTQRKVEVFQGYPEPPSIFDSTLFSLRGLEK